jgi:hypothetical protein
MRRTVDCIRRIEPHGFIMHHRGAFPVNRNRRIQRMRGGRERAVAVGLSIAMLLFWPVSAFLTFPWIFPADSDGRTVRAFERASVACLLLAAASAFTIGLATGAFGRRWLRTTGTIGIAIAIGLSAAYLFAIPGMSPNSAQLAALGAEVIAVVLAATCHRESAERF